MNKYGSIHIPATEPPGTDREAEAEGRILQSDYDKQFHKTKHYIRTSIVWSLFTLAFLITTVWVAHLLLPNGYRWLDEQNLLELKSIIVGAILGGVSSMLSRLAVK